MANRPKPQHHKPQQPRRKYTKADLEMIGHLREYGSNLLKVTEKYRGDKEKTIMYMEMEMVRMLGIVRDSNIQARISAFDVVLAYPILTGNADATTVPRSVVVKLRDQETASRYS